MLEPVADGGDLDLIQFTGFFLTIPGDEGNCRAFFEEDGSGGDLARLEGEFPGDFEDVFLDHGSEGPQIMGAESPESMTAARERKNAERSAIDLRDMVRGIAIQCSDAHVTRAAFDKPFPGGRLPLYRGIAGGGLDRLGEFQQP